MSTKEKCTTIAIVGAIAIGLAGFGLGVAIGGRTMDPNPALQEELAASEGRVAMKADTIAMLLDRVADRDSANVEMTRLYLLATTYRDTITLHYAPLRARISSADGGELRFILDSLRAGYLLDRARLRALLDTGGHAMSDPRANP